MLEPNSPQNAPGRESLRGRILIVDDEEVNLLLLESILRKAGYGDLVSTSDPREVLELCAESPPDVVLLDLHMPHLDGLTVIRQLRAHVPPTGYLPIIMLTADENPEAEHQALGCGASDFLHKPFKPLQIALRVKSVLETRFLHLELQRSNQRLEERVAERTRELEAAWLDVLERLALAAEYRDEETGQHTQRVGRLAARIGAELGLSDTEVELLRRAAPLHDVGKIGAPDHILLKPGKLSEEEYEVMKLHVEIGSSLLSHSRSELVRLAELIARTHHERYDGSGYPEGLSGEEIPLVGQIVAVADVFDTLLHRRPYKAPWPLEKAVGEINRQADHDFAPRVVAAFLRVLAEPGELLEDLEPAASI